MFVFKKSKGYILLSPLCSLLKVRFLFQLVPLSIPSDLPNIRTLFTFQRLTRLHCKNNIYLHRTLPVYSLTHTT